MTEKKKAIVIGAGVGGLATSLFLARKGFGVTVFEKNPSPGGRCGQLLRDGHRFDTGATIYLMPGVYKEVLESLDPEIHRNLALKPLTGLYTVYYDDGTAIEFTTDDKKLREELESVERGSYERARSYISKGYELFRLALNRLLTRNFTSFFSFATPSNALLLFRLRAFRSHQAYARRFFRHEHLRTAFTFQNIYVGQNPYRAPALFSMLPAAELTEGSMFPVGGMHAITRVLMETAERIGVKILCNSPVQRILTEGNKATGVVLEGGEVACAPVIVANADLPYVYRQLLPGSLRSRRIDRLRYTCSAIVLHWGLDKVYPRLGHHSVFISSEYRANLREVFRRQSLSSRPSFYVHAPVRTDPGAAPEGHDSLSVIIPAGHLDEFRQRDWNQLKNEARKYVLKRLAQAGLTDLEEHIKFEICYTPKTWQSVYNLSRGATFGSLAHNILQMGYFRPHNRHRRYRNLYFTGGSTHPGNGVPLVLLSAKLTSDRIINENGDGNNIP